MQAISCHFRRTKTKKMACKNKKNAYLRYFALRATICFCKKIFVKFAKKNLTSFSIYATRGYYIAKEGDNMMGVERKEMYSEKCICCGKNDVTWPRVCDECIDHEAQAALANIYGYEIMEGPYGDTYVQTGHECRSCGMIYDGGMCCTYCGDTDPLGDGEEDIEDLEEDINDSRLA
jgi:hypothetical protein